MKNLTEQQTILKSDGAHISVPAEFHVDESDRELFQREIAGFMPPNAFDVHAHFYDLAHLASAFNLPIEYSERGTLLNGESTAVGYEVYRRQQRAWLGELAPADGLFFAYPTRTLDVPPANRFLWEEIAPLKNSRGLMVITPRDEPAEVERQVRDEGWKGFKVYHLFAARKDTFFADNEEFLPEWAWEIAHRYELAITLHMVRPRALADEHNQEYIRKHCRKYPGAKLILAHAARGFCGHHTVEGIHAIRGLDNVYFDTSAICEAAPFEAILRAYGPTRLMYGSDFPVSEGHGRCVSLGDGFYWIYEWQDQAWTMGKPALIGIESLLALKQACRNLSLNDSDLELIFKDNARQLLLNENNVKQSEQELYREAKTLIPGGTQLLSKRPEMFAPDKWPPYFREAQGCRVLTMDKRELLDFSLCGIGSCLLGYAHPDVTEAVLRRVRLGAMSTLNPPEEVELAQKLIELHPWAEQARFMRSGGEALAAAVRIARAETQRDVVAFCGYHGWQDWYLAANLSGEESLVGHLLPGLHPSGVPRGLAGTALPFRYNELEELQKIVSDQGKSLAAVIMEPTRSVYPDAGFLEGVRELCDESGAHLIFDEVTIGFRLNYGGAHLKLGVEPDMAVFAKALGNGHPMAAVIGRQSTMQAAQDSFISSTYWTESVGPVAALATLEVMRQNDVPAHIARIGNLVRSGLQTIAEKHGVPIKIGGYPCLTTLAFEHAEANELLTIYTIEMLERGFMAGGAFYPTLAHEDEHVEKFLQAANEVFGYLHDIIARDAVTTTLQTPVKHTGFARLN